MPARSYVLIPLCVLSVAVFAGATYVTTSSTMPTSRQPEVPDPAPIAECVARLSQVGITPESLAAAGASTEVASSVLAAGVAYLTQERRADLRALEAQFSAAARNPHSGNLAALKQAKASIMEELFAFASIPLSGEQRLAVQQMHANRHWPVPTEYKTLDLPEGEWLGLRNALAAKRIGGDAQEIVPHSTDLSVMNARAGLDNAASIKQAWDMAMRQ